MLKNCDKLNCYVQIILFIFILLINNNNGLRTFTKNDILKLREEVREMFQHAYDGYLTYASEYDELRPLSCDGIDTWGSYSLTLIDALDTLAVMGNYTEFQRVVDILTQKSNFDSDINVSVFETNIRIVGGLISAHLLSHKAGIKLEPGWPCNGPLLRLAEDVARRLLPAFDTQTGMPYGTVNLKMGIPQGETSVTCTAGVGTFIIEFGALSRLTGDPIYEEIALNAIHTLYSYKSTIGLYGNHIDVRTGRWTAQDSGIGAGIDSYYEYLVKGSIMLNRPELLAIFNEGRIAIDKYLKRDDWHVWVSMNKGTVTIPVFQSLESYWPGLLSLIGETIPAMKTIHNYHSVWKQYGFLPEFYNIPNFEAGANRENYPLRPELIESAMYLYRSTGDPYLLEIGEDMLRSIQHSAKTPCGYATIKNVRDHRKEDRMESFFLAETTKYLYLLFDPDNFLNNDGGTGTIIDTPNGKCIIDAGGYIFNTEAHPIDPSALRCCYDLQRESLLYEYDTKKFIGDAFEIGRIKNYELFDNNNLQQSIENITFKSIDIDTQQTELQLKDTTVNKKRSNIVEDILNVLKETKEKRISLELEKQQQRLDRIQLNIHHDDTQVHNENIDDDHDKNSETDDSIILPTKKTVIEKGATVEIIKLSPSRDSDENNKSITTTTKMASSSSTATENKDVNNITDDNDYSKKTNHSNQNTNYNISSIYQLINNTQNISKQTIKEMLAGDPDIGNNNSLLTELLHTLLLKSPMPLLPKFDPQILLEKIRENGKYQNITQNYEILTCKAQPFLQRLTVLGEFF